MLKVEKYHLVMDTEGLYAIIVQVYLNAMVRATDRLVEIMRREVDRTTHGGAPGKPGWRESLKKDLMIFYPMVISEILEYGAGLDYTPASDEYIRAMIVAYGSGSAVGGNPIHRGPKGRMVYGADIGPKHKSRVKKGPMPKEFNQVGNQFVQNSMKLIKSYFNTVLRQAGAAIPQSVYYGSV